MVESSKIASGSPALLIGVYFNSVISFASLMGYIPASNHVPILVVSILAGFLVFLGGFIELIRGDILGGTLNLVFGLFFIMLSGVVNLLVFQGSLFNVPVESGTATGWIFLALGITLVILTPINFFLSGIVSMLLLCADVGVLIIAFVSLGVLNPSLMPLAAWLILILGLIAMYISAGTLYNTVLGKAIFPMGGPFIKSHPDSKK